MDGMCACSAPASVATVDEESSFGRQPYPHSLPSGKTCPRVRSIIRPNDAKCRNVAQMRLTRYEPVHTIVGHDEGGVRVVRVAKRHDAQQALSMTRGDTRTASGARHNLDLIDLRVGVDRGR